MNFNLLPVFLAVADARNFSTAAAKLGVRRSSVSRGVAALERDLGVQLFSRTTRQVALTTAGLALYAKLGPKLNELTEVLGDLPEQEEAPSGELRISAPHDLGATVLPAMIAAFSLRAPNVRLDVRLSNRYVDLVSERYDAALRVGMGRLRDSSLVAKKLVTLETRVYAAPAYLARMGGAPRTPDDAARYEWVTLPGPMPKSCGLRNPVKKVVSDDLMFCRGAAVAGLGLTVLPAFLGQDDVATGRLVRVLPKVSVPTGALYFVHAPAKHLPRKLTAFRDALVEHFAAHPLLVS